MRSMMESGTDTRSSFFMNSALRALTSGQMPAMTGILKCSILRMKFSSNDKSKHRLRDRELSASLDLEFKRRISSSILGTPGFAPIPMAKARTGSDRVAANIEPAIEIVNNVYQADRVHVEDRGCVGIAAHFRRVAGNANQVSDSDCGRAQQVGLNAQHIAVPAGVMQDGFDSGLLLQKQRQGLVTHTGGGARAIRNIDCVHATDFRNLAPVSSFSMFVPFGGTIFHHGDELAASDLCSHS